MKSRIRKAPVGRTGVRQDSLPCVLVATGVALFLLIGSAVRVGAADSSDVAASPDPKTLPVADAGPDIQVGDPDRDGRQEVTLDASRSHDDIGIKRYTWTIGSFTLYQGSDAVVRRELLAGATSLRLKVEDADGREATDDLVVMIDSPATRTLALDISTGFNYDAVATGAEAEAASAWFKWVTSANPKRARRGDGQYDSSNLNAFTPPEGLVHPPDAEWYGGAYHHGFFNYYTACLRYQADNPWSIQPVVRTPYGDYRLGAFDAGAALKKTDVETLPASPNAIRLGVARGAATDAPEGKAEKTVLLPASQQRTYTDVNFLLSGESAGGGKLQADGSFVPNKRAWFLVYAIYRGSEEPVLVYRSPPMAEHPAHPYGTEGDSEVPGGIPFVGGLTEANRRGWAPGFLEWSKHAVCRTYMGVDGSGGRVNMPLFARNDLELDSGAWYMWEPRAAGIPLDATRKLAGFRFVLDSGPNLWMTGYQSGENINIYAAAANPADGGK